MTHLNDENDDEFRLTDNQRAAVHAMVDRWLNECESAAAKLWNRGQSGNTGLVLRLEATTNDDGISIDALASPTGKAAKRLSEATDGRRATTLHRVLALLELDHLDHRALSELGAIVDRNQNDGEFSEWVWLALRDWYRSVMTARLARRTAADAVQLAETKP